MAGIDPANNLFDLFEHAPVTFSTKIHMLVSYTFCPGIAVGKGTGTGIESWASHGQSIYGSSDRILNGHVCSPVCAQVDSH